MQDILDSSQYFKLGRYSLFSRNPSPILNLASHNPHPRHHSIVPIPRRLRRRRVRPINIRRHKNMQQLTRQKHNRRIR